MSCLRSNTVRSAVPYVRVVLLVLALAGFFALVGSARAGSPSTPLHATSGPPFVYVANSASALAGATDANSHEPSAPALIVNNNISAYSLDLSSGALSEIAGSPFASGGGDTNSVVIDPAGRFLYATNENSRSVAAYTINPGSGFLTPVLGSPFASGNGPNAATVHPSGKFLYVPNENENDIWVYAINQGSGALTPVVGSPFVAGALDDWIAFDPMGRFAYVTNNGAGTVSGYTVNQSTGALTPIVGSPWSAGTEPDSAVVDLAGKFLYVANFSDQNISVYGINQTTGALSEIAGSPFNTGGSPDHILIDRSGKFVYTANDGNCGAVKNPGQAPSDCSAGVGASRIIAASGALTTVVGSAFSAGNSPSGLAVDFSNRYLFAANENGNNVSAFALNSGNGVLTPTGGGPFKAGGEPVKIAITPTLAPAPPAQVPEGDTLVLVGSGLAGLAGYAALRWRARRAGRPARV